MKYAFIRDQCKRHSVTTLCQYLQVSRSGFHTWLGRGPSARQQEDAALLVAIRRIHLEHRCAYGGVKTWRTLNQRGMVCGVGARLKIPSPAR